MKSALSAVNAVLFAMLALLTCESLVAEDGKESVPIRIGWQIPAATQAEITQVLKRTDVLASHGLEPSLIPFSFGTPQVEAAYEGKLDVLFAGDQPAINLVARGGKWKIVARIFYDRISVIVPPNSPIQDVSDLKGKIVASPFGSVGHHFFDQQFHVFRRIKELIKIRQGYPALRYGRQYLRQIRNFSQPFVEAPAGEIIAWSRILDEEGLVCIVNGHGNDSRGADVLVDRSLNSAIPCFFKVLVNTEEIIEDAGYTGTHKAGEEIQVQYEGDIAYLAIRDIAPSGVIVLTNRG